MTVRAKKVRSSMDKVEVAVREALAEVSSTANGHPTEYEAMERFAVEIVDAILKVETRREEAKHLVQSLADCLSSEASGLRRNVW
jgi:phage terminase small subunit